MDTLRVRNESANAITIGEGAAAVTIAAGGEQELSAALLQSRAFTDRLAAAELRFVLTQNPGEDRVALARRVFPGLLRGIGPRFLALSGRLDGAVAKLEQRRLEYNHSWGQSKPLLDAAAASADAATNLVKSAFHLAVNVRMEQVVEDELKEELDALKSTDPATIENLPAFLEQVRAKEAELAKAQAKRKAAEVHYVAPYESLMERLEAVAQKFEDADPAADIGQPVPPFP